MVCTITELSSCPSEFVPVSHKHHLRVVFKKCLKTTTNVSLNNHTPETQMTRRPNQNSKQIYVTNVMHGKALASKFQVPIGDGFPFYYIYLFIKKMARFFFL